MKSWRVRFIFAGMVLFMGLAQSWSEVSLEPVVTGLRFPTYVTHAGDGSGRLFVVERGGRIRILDREGHLLEKDFLNLGRRGLNRSTYSEKPSHERGLLGLAFHPDYSENGRFFVHYSRKDKKGADLDGATIIAEYHVSEDPNVAATEERIVLGPIEQPFKNHNGGSIEFNAAWDEPGHLYIALGDGGSKDDPSGNGQNTHTLLGTILRIDVDSGDPYGIPSDNPFVGKEGLDEIYAYGLRNAWRFSFDRENGRLFAGDVGQVTREEVDLIEKGGNYGWNIMEGFSCFNPEEGCDRTGLVLPIAQYLHPTGCSVTGGYVYRGSRFPSFYGLYFYADYCVGRIWTLEENEARGTWYPPIERLNSGRLISSFGEDEEGELYVVENMMTDGKILRVVDRPKATGSRTSNGDPCACSSTLEGVFKILGLQWRAVKRF